MLNLFIFLQDIEGMSLSDDLQYGYIAQEVQEVFPEVVKVQTSIEFDDDDNLIESAEFLSIDYLNFLALGVAKFQQQDSVIEENLNKLSALQSRIDDLLVELTAGLNGKSLNPEQEFDQYKVFPNPVMEKVLIEKITNSKNTALVEVIDLNGNVLIESEFPASLKKFELNISHLAQGVYQVIVKNNEHFKSTTIIKR